MVSDLGTQAPEGIVTHDIIKKPESIKACPRSGWAGTLQQRQSPANVRILGLAGFQGLDMFTLPPSAAAEPTAPASRTRLSLRCRIIAGFSICFCLSLSITLLSLYVLLQLQTKQHFLEVADTFMLELQQARRFEKNFFLYGTNLADALAHVHTAQQLMRVNAAQLAEVVGLAQVEGLQQEIQQYAQLLEALLATTAASGETASGRGPLEADLRRHGAAVLTQGLHLVHQERQAVAHMLALAKRVPLYFLAFLFVVMAFLAHKLSRQILGPLSRLKQFTQRIAQGETAPVPPTHGYQDELHDLTQALRTMVAELQRRQEIMTQSEKLRALGTLTAGIAHELNNPINNITLTAYGLRDEGASCHQAERTAMVQEIIDEADRLRGIVSHLLDYARESEVILEPVDLTQLLQETLLLVSKQVKLAGAQLELDLPPHLPVVQGDRRQLRQALLNLILNALDAIPPQGRIHIAAHPEGAEAVAITITDNGLGIPAAILPSIFDPFFTTKPPGQGTGLGLAVSQGIITRHGGTIRVASKEGQGSTFTVILPVKKGTLVKN